MANKSKKDFNAMMNNNKDMPKTQIVKDEKIVKKYGRTIITTGNMADRIATKSKQNYIYVNFNSKIEKDTLIIIKDQDNKIITALKTSKNITTLFYSNENLDYKH